MITFVEMRMLKLPLLNIQTSSVHFANASTRLFKKSLLNMKEKSVGSIDTFHLRLFIQMHKNWLRDQNVLQNLEVTKHFGNMLMLYSKQAIIQMNH